MIVNNDPTKKVSRGINTLNEICVGCSDREDNVALSKLRAGADNRNTNYKYSFKLTAVCTLFWVRKVATYLSVKRFSCVNAVKLRNT